MVISRALRTAARQISSLAEIEANIHAQIAKIHGSDVEWLHGHVLDQSSPLAQFPPHQDTNEEYSTAGKKTCEVWYTALVQLGACGRSAMEVLGCKEAAVYSGPGSGFVFRSALWHRTLYAESGVWKLAMFYGKYI